MTRRQDPECSRRRDEVTHVQTRPRKWTVPIVTTAINDLDDFTELDPSLPIIDLPE
jgi:hypothetical protein